MILLAVDPGRDTGWALFRDQDLEACGVGDARSAYTNTCRVVIEKPQVYSAAHSKGDPNDLITLAIQVGEYKEHFQARGAPVTLVLPRDWKGQVPKNVCAARVNTKLSEKERSVVAVAGRFVSAGKLHNMLDAVGIGLFALSRAKCGII